MKILILAMTLISSQYSFATNIEIWEGAGSLFDVKGNPTFTYNLVVENTKNGNQIQRNVTVTLSDGTTHKQQCLMTKTSQDAWTSNCDHGNGSGKCFGEGLCISYESNSSGKAYSTTIVMDGPSEIRLMRTELQNGQAVQFFREKLHKK